MAYTQEQIDEKFGLILKDLLNGRSLRQSLQGYKMPSSETFYDWINNDEEKAKQYVRAKDFGLDAIIDEMHEIAADSSDVYVDEFGNKRVDGAAVQKKRLMIDTKKWDLSKKNPRKFGDRIDVTSGDEPIRNPVINLGLLSNKVLEELEAAANKQNKEE